ncbi:MAG: DUF4160 domain-containing protein [bacterium]
MGRVDAFEVPGLRLWFNSSDHLPVHFHASRRGEWEIRVYFLLCSEGYLEYDLKWGDVPPRAELEAILRSTLEHRGALLEEWEAKVCI